MKPMERIGIIRVEASIESTPEGKSSILIGSQKVDSWLFETHYFFGESEKCHFRFPHKLMTTCEVINFQFAF